MEVSVVYLAGGAREAGAVEVRHEIDVMTGQVSVVSEMALVEGGLGHEGGLGNGGAPWRGWLA
jgi:hypothetical protein